MSSSTGRRSEGAEKLAYLASGAGCCQYGGEASVGPLPTVPLLRRKDVGARRSAYMEGLGFRVESRALFALDPQSGKDYGRVGSRHRTDSIVRLSHGNRDERAAVL